MKTLLIIIASTLSMLYHCGSESETKQFDFIIAVDSIVHPQQVMLKDTITVKFYGKVGAWYSRQFKHIDIVQKDDSLILTAVGAWYSVIDYRKDTYLDGMERKFLARRTGMLHIKVRQPDGVKPIEHSIVVD
ncbi:MAG: hypothetical protein HUU02_02195 [Bacteroidetes bacterium]|nr:hypothetical protein [Bacteroidota bacterium]